ncbi:hypothetical protein VB715_17580 [Crocosphaera sp. UHCC 0190]|uniref:hypothetical protein n=1 Tax=Crocosphaera sp. UHCC 0190 TaxID=3110246 RepID=UPI002B212C74|nr:hypothetical protein [Crocosphaera sp. UHCC 0190]MEA5511588.1 hypothetical protein [Crocosphaera sp. UHCC 0190]
MLTTTITRVALTLSAIAALSLPAVANPEVATMTNQTKANSEMVLPQSTALLVSFPNPMVVDVGQSESYPIILPLIQDIKLPSGEVIIPANTPVSLTIKPTQDGAMLVADAIILNGQIIPIVAQSAKLPGRTITNMSGQQMARQNSAVGGNLATSLLGAAGADLSTMQRGGFGGAALGLISGLGSPNDVRIVEINAGSVHILKLNSSVELVSR